MSGAGSGYARPVQKRAVALLLTLLPTIAPAVAYAKEPSSSSREPAAEARRTELYREGRLLADQKKWPEAAAKFREVVNLRSAPKALIALAVAEENLGHPAEAKHLYARALTDSHEAGREHADDARLASDALARLTPRVPRVTLEPPAGTTVAKASVDGQPSDLHDNTIEMEPGEHRLSIESADGRRVEITRSVAEGGRLTIVVAFPARSDPPPAPIRPVQPAPAGGEARAIPVGPILVASAGVLLAGAGTVFWLLGKSDENDARAGCRGLTTDCPRTIQSTVDSASTKIVVGDVLVVAGAAAIAGGGLWWLLSPKSSRDGRARAARGLSFSASPSGGCVTWGTDL